MGSETLTFFMELAVVIVAIILGAQMGGIGLGLWGGVGLLVLTYVFHVVPTSPPITAILIIVAVTIAAASMEVAGGIDFLVEIAKKALKSNPESRPDHFLLTCRGLALLRRSGHSPCLLSPDSCHLPALLQ